MKNTKIESTFERIMKDPKRRDRFEEKYARFLLSEIILGLMTQEKISVRQLAQLVGVSPTVIQGIRTGKRRNITFKNFLALTSALGATVRIEKGNKSFELLE